jgi:murein DD-endopeptidase MepM/ murein hydrolase activator NlpD
VVRTFSRTTRVRGLAALVAGSLLLGVAAVPLASADDDLKAKKHKVQRQINGAHEELEESSARARRAHAALNAAQVQLDRAQAHLARMRGQLAAAEVLDRRMQARLEAAIEHLREARAELDDGREKVADQQDTLGQIVVANYQSGDPSLMGLSMVLTSQNPAELTGQLNSVQNVIDKEAVVLDRLEASRALLIVQEQQVAAAKVQVAEQRKAAAENLRRKQRLEEQAEAAEASVQERVAARAVAQREAARARAADLAELRNLEQERNRISAILKRRAAEARRKAAAAARRAGRSSGGGGGGPVSSGGFLDYPVNGPVTSPFGWRTHPIYGYQSLHDGTDFGAGCGTPIRAAADGRVMEEYFQTAWGNRIIIDHGFHRGVGLATISNHLSGYAVSVGQHVRRGQVVGYVGTTGWSTGCHLHYTVMQNGNPVNPMSWF